MIPGGIELFAFDAALLRAVLFEEVECQSSQRRQVRRRVSGSRPAPVFATLHIQHPVQ